MYLSKFAQSPEVAEKILDLIKLITISDLSPNKDLDDFNHSIFIGKPNLNIKPDGLGMEKIVKSYFSEYMDENEKNIIEEYQKELEIKRSPYFDFSLGATYFLYGKLRDRETLKKLQERILNDDLMIVDMAEIDLAIYLFSDKDVQFNILQQVACERCKKLVSLTIQEKKMILFELIGACYCNGNFDEKQKLMLEFICKELKIDEEYVEEFLDIAKKYFSYLSELNELINE